MDRFIGFVKKEFYHIFRDPRTLLILFGIPVMQLIIFGFVVTNEIQDAKISILDYSKDHVTSELTNKILSSGYFILHSNLKSDKEIESVLKKGDAKIVIVFEHNFAKNLEKEKTANLQIIADASDPNTANLITNYTSGIVHDYLNKKNQQMEMPLQIVPEVRMMYNQSLKGVFMFVPGTMALILMLVSAMMTSISISREKEFGSMEVLLVSPLKPHQIVIGKVAPYVMLSFVNAISIIALGYFVFGLPIRGSMSLLLFESLLFITMALSLGILISTVSPNQQVAMFISMFALLLPTILLSGFIFPVENMPKVLYYVSFIIPPKYFIIIIKNIMIKGTGLMFVWRETLIIIGFTVFFIALSVKKFKIRLE